MAEILLDHNSDLQDFETSALIANTLEDHYPGWGWEVRALTSQGVAFILNSSLSGMMQKQFGFQINLDDASASELKARIIRYGGEFLERANMPRRKNMGEKATSLDIS